MNGTESTSWTSAFQSVKITDMLKNWIRRTCEHPTTAMDGCLTRVRCVKPQYALRIEEIWAVD
jgi:hypothetical protein